MKNFEAIKKPIYIAELKADASLYNYSTDAVDVFIKKHPEYADCQYHRICEGRYWIIRFYRECAEDIVEV